MKYVATNFTGLGNQILTYICTKTICEENSLDFAYAIRKDFRDATDSDDKYGDNIVSIFNIPESERFEHIADLEKKGEERKIGKEPSVATVTKVSDTLSRIDSAWDERIFRNRLSDIRKWLVLPEDRMCEVEERLSAIRQKYPNRTLVAVHFRTCRLVYGGGGVLSYAYWRRTAQQAKRDFTEKPPLFLCIYDAKTNYVKRFIKEFSAIDMGKNSLVTDLGLLSRCDAVIVSNSTFSTCGAILNGNAIKVYRPSTYPSRGKNISTSLFLNEWITIDAKVARGSKMMWDIRKNRKVLFDKLVQVTWLRKIFSKILSSKVRTNIVGRTCSTYSNDMNKFGL